MMKEEAKREMTCPRCARPFRIAESLIRWLSKPVHCYRCAQYLKVKERIAAGGGIA